MATVNATVYQNEYLPDGGTDVTAIVRIAVADAGEAGAEGTAGEVIMVDVSGSMGQTNMRAAQFAAAVALDTIPHGTWFAVVAGAHRAFLAYPQVRSGPAMVRMNDRTRHQAKATIALFQADGGTAIGTWLDLTRRIFESMGDRVANRHALLLTDGENRDETPEQFEAAIRRCVGQFQCDCRGVGTDWVVDELRRISTALLGSLDIIPHPRMMAAEFATVMQASAGRGVADAKLRVWAPQGARVLSVSQVAPTLTDLTQRAQPVNALTHDYPTGSWGDEERDYRVVVRLPPRNVGQEQLAARVQLVVSGQPRAQGLVKANWTNDSTLTAPINPEVAHYTGQTELATAIQQGLAARAAGDLATATTRLGRAMQLAHASGNTEVGDRLGRIVEVQDAATGRIRLRADVDKADEMALDTASTRTSRVK